MRDGLTRTLGRRPPIARTASFDAPRAMPNALEAWYASAPAVTRMYLTLTTLVTLGCALEVLTRLRDDDDATERRRMRARRDDGRAEWTAGGGADAVIDDDAGADVDAGDIAAECVL